MISLNRDEGLKTYVPDKSSRNYLDNSEPILFCNSCHRTLSMVIEYCDMYVASDALILHALSLS